MVPFDADLEYAAEDIFGCSILSYRPLRRGVRGSHVRLQHRLSFVSLCPGKSNSHALANVLFDACISDLHTCLKLIPIDLFRSIRLSETGFGLDTEISASLLRRGVRPFEVPVSYFSRSHEEGKKITWRDAFACLWILLRVRTLPRSRFLRTNDLPDRDNRGGAVDLEPGGHGHWSARTITAAEAEISVGLAGAE